jgi:hypothetical protein
MNYDCLPTSRNGQDWSLGKEQRWAGLIECCFAMHWSMMGPLWWKLEVTKNRQ